MAHVGMHPGYWVPHSMVKVYLAAGAVVKELRPGHGWVVLGEGEAKSKARRRLPRD